jgi:DNA-binding LacI/PurR family transcriptional regulator
LKSLAELAGVSAQTVSLALRNHPACKAQTRERIQRLAAKVGYRPDPTLSKLMGYLRTARAKRVKATICGLTTRRQPFREPYLEALVAGGQARAAALGYAFDVITVDPAAPRIAGRLHRILQARGVDGLLLLPMAESGEFSALTAWENYSLVSVTYSVTAPVTHRVVPSSFNNTIRLCQHLAGLGYRRPGLVTSQAYDHRVGHLITAAIAWLNTGPHPDRVPPLLVHSTLEEEFPAWWECHRPDAIIAHSDFDLERIRRLLPAGAATKTGLACSSAFHFLGRHDLAGIDEQPAEIGAAAIDLLASLIQHGDRGLPPNPRTTLVEGRFRPGRSAPGRSV